jgi:hypothetical protein
MNFPSLVPILLRFPLLYLYWDFVDLILSMAASLGQKISLASLVFVVFALHASHIDIFFLLDNRASIQAFFVLIALDHVCLCPQYMDYVGISLVWSRTIPDLNRSVADHALLDILSVIRSAIIDSPAGITLKRLKFS